MVRNIDRTSENNLKQMTSCYLSLKMLTKFLFSTSSYVKLIESVCRGVKEFLSDMELTNEIL